MPVRQAGKTCLYLAVVAERSMIALRFICLATVFNALKCQTFEENDPGVSPRIVNGRRAEPGQFPFAVSLQFVVFRRLRTHLCTLSLITTRTCLGAAHCAVEDDGTKFSTRRFCGIVGSIAQSRDVACHNYSDIIAHDGYDPEGVPNDIALFIFEREMELDERFLDVVPLIASIEFNSENITALGWGNLFGMNDDFSPRTLRYVDLNLLPVWSCGVDDDSCLCIATAGKGFCAGDSGGPNIISVNGKQIQVGISSIVKGECGTNFSIAMAVGPFTDWIKNNSVGEPMFLNEQDVI